MVLFEKQWNYVLRILIVMAPMNKKYIMTNIYYIAPIAIWIAFYGAFFINPVPFTKPLIILLFLGVFPYGILWTLASRFPDKAKYCQSVSIAMVIITVFIGIKYFYFSRNAEEAIGFFLLPVFILGLIFFIILFLPVAAIIVHIRRRFKRRPGIEQ
jgi:hypothetical protein